jgi:outer membrane protein assembly factor BamE (lipoprotein component of BamABCDE complex)
MRTHFALIAVLFAALATGCISPADRLEPEVVRQVKEGMNWGEIEKIMGKPHSVVIGSGEKSVAHYGYTRRIDSAEFQLIGAFAKNGGDILLRHLSLLYNRNNVAEKVLFHQSLTPFGVGFGRASAGQVLAPETLRQIKKGVSTQDEVVKIFGEPTMRALDPDGDLGMVWHYAKSQIGWTKNQNDFQTLTITFDKTGVVKEQTLSGNVGTQ